MSTSVLEVYFTLPSLSSTVVSYAHPMHTLDGHETNNNGAALTNYRF